MQPQYGYFLNNGNFIPAVGLGTWLAGPGEVGNAVLHSLNNGYRLIDCARFYGNEKEIGSLGITPFLKQEHTTRSELFISSKLWPNQVTRVEESCKESIKDLCCNYLDLYLIHWPVAIKVDAETPPKPDDFLDIDIVETWKEMEKLVDAGLVKSIGLSNANPSTILKIMENCRIKPVVNQVELNVYFQQKALKSVCDKYHIILQGYRPLGGRPKDPNVKNCLDDEVVIELAKKYNKTTGQICIKWMIQHKIVSIPKSTNEQRIIQNFDVFNWTLEEDDMNRLDSQDKKRRAVLGSDFYNGRTYEQFWETD
ncbi:Aldose reductase [Entamoeba marina]